MFRLNEKLAWMERQKKFGDKTCFFLSSDLCICALLQFWVKSINDKTACICPSRKEDIGRNLAWLKKIHLLFLLLYIFYPSLNNPFFFILAMKSISFIVQHCLKFLKQDKTLSFNHLKRLTNYSLDDIHC